jgi:hypothetical protein
MSDRTAIEIGTAGSDDAPALTSVSLDLRALDLVTHWKRCGLSADWLAAFFAYDFELGKRRAAESVLATAINELIENAAKFCADKRAMVTLSVHQHGDFIRLETRNLADDARTTKLREAVDSLAGDLDALFAKRIEQQDEPGASGVGLLILKKDYGARIGARLIEQSAGVWEVRMQVTLDVTDFEGGT